MAQHQLTRGFQSPLGSGWAEEQEVGAVGTTLALPLLDCTSPKSGAL